MKYIVTITVREDWDGNGQPEVTKSIRQSDRCIDYCDIVEDMINSLEK